MDFDALRRLIELAIDEDLGTAGDLSARLLPDPDLRIEAALRTRAAGVLAGVKVAPEICAAFGARLEAEFEFTAASADGDALQIGQRIARLRGPRAAVLALERTLLNFMGRLSGIATLTRRYVDAARVANPNVQVLDTRKTIPGWRTLDKYAVLCGGGVNHRMGLHDAILIKDNHIAGVPTDRLAATLFELLNRADGRASFVEVEVDTLDQLEQVLKVVGVQVVLLDNLSLEELRMAVALRNDLGLRGRVALEASGGITLATIGAVAETGVDRISVGALTHSASVLDLGLDFEPPGAG